MKDSWKEEALHISRELMHLTALDAMGVDNWEGFGDAQSYIKESFDYNKMHPLFEKLFNYIKELEDKVAGCSWREA